MMAAHREGPLCDASRLLMEIGLRLTKPNFWRFSAYGPVVCRRDTDYSSDGTAAELPSIGREHRSWKSHRRISMMTEHRERERPLCDASRLLMEIRLMLTQQDFCRFFAKGPVVCRHDNDCSISCGILTCSPETAMQQDSRNKSPKKNVELLDSLASNYFVKQ